MAAVRVAVIGTNGTLAPTVFKHLLDSGFVVSGLTRDASTCKLKDPVKIVQPDYFSVESLAPSLKGFDVVVDLLNRNLWEISIRVVDAAIVAGVPFIMPSAYGLDLKQDFLRKLPPIQGKAKLEEYVATKGDAGEISYAMIETAMFLDWALAKNVILPLAGGTMHVWNKGDVKGTSTLLDDIGRAVATAIKKRRDPAVRNKILFVQSRACSMLDVFEAAKAADPGKTWDLAHHNPDETLKKTWEAYNSGDRDPGMMRGFLGAGAYGKGLTTFEHLDNEILGITQLSDQEFKDIVAMYVNKGSDAPYPFYKD